MKRMPSRKAEPAEQRPNSGDWYVIGQCNHMSTKGVGVLYGVCSDCAERVDEFARRIKKARAAGVEVIEP